MYTTISLDYKDWSNEATEHVREALTPFNMFVYDVDTGGDSYLIVISNEAMTDEDLKKVLEDV